MTVGSFIGIILVAVYLLYRVVKLMWKAWSHPAHQLGMQAANMNWIANGRYKDSNGFANTKFKRGNLEAIVSFKLKKVFLTKPFYPVLFDDFIDVERWIAINGDFPVSEDHVKYMDNVRQMLKKNSALDLYEKMLLDKEWSHACLQLQKAAIQAGKPVEFTAYFIIESISDFLKEPCISLEALRSLTGLLESEFKASLQSSLI